MSSSRCSYCGEDYSALSDDEWDFHNGESRHSLPNCIQEKNNAIKRLEERSADLVQKGTEWQRAQIEELEAAFATLEAALAISGEIKEHQRERIENLNQSLIDIQKDKLRIDWLDQSKMFIQLHHTVEGAWEVNHQYLGRMGGPTSFRYALDRAMEPRK
jgi:hypothetical protein